MVAHIQGGLKKDGTWAALLVSKGTHPRGQEKTDRRIKPKRGGQSIRFQSVGVSAQLFFSWEVYVGKKLTKLNPSNWDIVMIANIGTLMSSNADLSPDSILFLDFAY